MSFGAGSDDILILKTDAFGNLQWARTFVGDSSDGGAFVSFQQTTDGGYILGGMGTRWSVHWGVSLLKTDANGNEGNHPKSKHNKYNTFCNFPNFNHNNPNFNSTSEDQRFDGCFADVLIAGKGYISLGSAGEFNVKVYGVRGNVVKDVKGKGVLRINLGRGIYFVEVFLTL